METKIPNIDLKHYNVIIIPTAKFGGGGGGGGGSPSPVAYRF